MRRTYTYRLSPNKEGTSKLYWTLPRCREFYNAAFSEYKDASQQHIGTRMYQHSEGQWILAEMQATIRVNEVSSNQQPNDLPELKHEIREEYQDIAAHVLQDVLRRLDKGMKAFYRRLREGQTPGFPRFQGRERYDSFTYPDLAGWKLEGTQLPLSQFGTVKGVIHRPIEGTIKTVPIKKEVDRWYVCFSCEVSEPEKLPVRHEDVGIREVSHIWRHSLTNGIMGEHPSY